MHRYNSELYMVVLRLAKQQRHSVQTMPTIEESVTREKRPTTGSDITTIYDDTI